MRCALLRPFTNYSLSPSWKTRRSHQVRGQKRAESHQSLPLPGPRLGPLPGEQNGLPPPPSSAASFQTHRQGLEKQKDLSSRWARPAGCSPALEAGGARAPRSRASCLSRQWGEGREPEGAGTESGPWTQHSKAVSTEPAMACTRACLLVRQGPLAHRPLDHRPAPGLTPDGRAAPSEATSPDTKSWSSFPEASASPETPPGQQKQPWSGTGLLPEPVSRGVRPGLSPASVSTFLK